MDRLQSQWRRLGTPGKIAVVVGGAAVVWILVWPKPTGRRGRPWGGTGATTIMTGGGATHPVRGDITTPATPTQPLQVAPTLQQLFAPLQETAAALGFTTGIITNRSGVEGDKTITRTPTATNITAPLLGPTTWGRVDPTRTTLFGNGRTGRRNGNGNGANGYGNGNGTAPSNGNGNGKGGYDYDRLGQMGLA